MLWRSESDPATQIPSAIVHQRRNHAAYRGSSQRWRLKHDNWYKNWGRSRERLTSLKRTIEYGITQMRQQVAIVGTGEHRGGASCRWGTFSDWIRPTH